MTSLTTQQRLFAHEYIRHQGNGKQAAIAAGYSERTAESQASRLLRNVKVAELVASLEARQLARVDVSAERVKQELARIAFSDVGQAYDENGRLRPIQDIPEDARRAIAGVKVFEEFEGYGEDRTKVGEVREVKLWSKPDALQTLAKHLGMLRDMLEVSGTGGGPLVVRVDRDE